jgi:hypothetical protein
MHNGSKHASQTILVSRIFLDKQQIIDNEYKRYSIHYKTINLDKIKHYNGHDTTMQTSILICCLY